MELKKKTIVLSKPNQIGDALMAFPLASALKKIEPDCHIIYLGKQLVQPLVELYQDIDSFIAIDTLEKLTDKEQILFINEKKIHIWLNILPHKKLAILARKANIPIRIGVWRFYHLLNCNRFINIRRSQSNLHETQLDLLFLKALSKKPIDY